MRNPTLYLFRHGETDYNVTHRMQGQLTRSALPGVVDQDLNAKGVAQAENLATQLRALNVPLDVIVSSDAPRAMRTANIVAAAYTGVDVVPSPALSEVFFGVENEGLDTKTFRARTFSPPLVFADTITGKPIEVLDGATIRRLHKCTDARYDNMSHPGGETKVALRARALAGLKEFILAHPDAHNIGVSGHSVLLRVLMPEVGLLDNAACVQAVFDLETFKIDVVKHL